MIYLLIALIFLLILDIILIRITGFKSIQANFIFYMHTFNICFLDIICNPDENLLWIANYISKTYVKSVHIKNKICLYTFKPVIRIKIISKINKKSIKSINRSIKSINVKK